MLLREASRPGGTSPGGCWTLRCPAVRCRAAIRWGPARTERTANPGRDRPPQNAGGTPKILHSLLSNTLSILAVKMRYLKKYSIKKWIIGIRTLIVILGLGIYLFVTWKSEELPKGEKGPAAEALTDSILKAVNITAWDTLEYVHWSFRGETEYLWDIQNHKVRIQWDDIEVLLDPKTVSGRVQKGGEILTAGADTYIQTSFEKFCNDGFWMNAFTKLRDPGTQRSLVKGKNGREGLLVTYMEGGVTPGDSYLWWPDETGRPESYQMWVSIIPVGGMSFTWENWDTLYNGAWIALDHKNELLDVSIENVQSGPTLEAMGFEEGVFDYFLEN